MKFSEAIRLGSLLRPQAFYEYASADGRTCALGAAMEAVGVTPRYGEGMSGEEVMYKELQTTADWLEWRRDMTGKNPPCPVCGDMEYHGHTPDGQVVKRNVSSVVIHLNNDHRWTREQIAEWVATFEPVHRPAKELAAV